MGFDILSFNILRLDGLTVPLKFDGMYIQRRGEHATVFLSKSGGIRGVVKCDMLQIVDIEITGEGSFRGLNLLQNALEECKAVGHLDAILVWSNGECSRFVFTDGKISEADINIVALVQERNELQHKLDITWKRIHSAGLGEALIQTEPK